MATYRGTPAQGLSSATAGFFIGFAAVALFGPTAKLLNQVMQLGPVAVGLLVAVPSLSGSLLRIPFSAWVDTTGGRKPFLVLLILSIIGMLGLYLVVQFLYPERLTASLYPLLLVLGVLSGCGIATFSVGISQVSYWFPQSRQGSALGFYAGVGNIAPGIFSFLLPVAMGSVGLAGAYLFWLLLLVAGTLVYYFGGRNAWYFQLREQGVVPEAARVQAAEAGQEIFPAKSMRESLSLSAGVWKTWALVIVYFTSFGGFIALTAWLPTYWQELFGLPLVTAGGLTALYAILTSVIRVPGGGIADRLGGENTLLLSLTSMLAGALLLFFSQSYGLSIFAEVLLGVGMGISNAAVFKLVPQEVPQAVGGAAGWVGGLGAFGGFAIPPLMGSFVTAYGGTGYAKGFLVFVALAVLSMITAWVLKRGRLD